MGTALSHWVDVGGWAAQSARREQGRTAVRDVEVIESRLLQVRIGNICEAPELHSAPARGQGLSLAEAGDELEDLATHG
jgi:hypothetical protein